MKYQRTQISLDPGHHQQLVDEAADRGISLAELLRQIVSEHVAEQAAPYEAKSWNAITGIAETEGEMDVARHFDDYMAEAMDRLYRKKMSLLEPEPPKPRKSSTKRKSPRK